MYVLYIFTLHTIVCIYDVYIGTSAMRMSTEASPARLPRSCHTPSASSRAASAAEGSPASSRLLPRCARHSGLRCGVHGLCFKSGFSASGFMV